MRKFAFIILSAYMLLFQGCITTDQPLKTETKNVVYDTTGPFLNPVQMPGVWKGYDIEERNTLDREIKSYYDKIVMGDASDELYADLGLLLYQRCRLDEAAEAFEKAIEIEPYEPEYFYFLGCVYFFSKRYDLTNQNIKRAKQLGFNINPNILEYFRGTAPASLDYLRAKIKLNLEAPYEKKGLYIKNINDVLDLREDEIDIATVFIILSHEASEKIYFESFDNEYYMRGIDIMVRDVLTEIGSETRPSWLSSAITNYMFHKRRFRAVNTTKHDKLYQLNFMNYVLLNGKGTDLSLSLLYLSVAERLNLPVYGVMVPSHFFVRYDDMVSQINIEMTAGGKNFDNDYYHKEYPFSKKGNSIYLKNLSKTEVVAYCLNLFSDIYFENNLLDEAKRYLDLALKLSPEISETYLNLGKLYVFNGDYQSAVDIYKKGLAVNSRDTILLKELGIALMLKGDLEQALEEIKLAEAINPSDPEIRMKLGVVYNKNKLYNEAIYELRRSEAYFPDSPELLTELAIAYYYMGNYDVAWQKVKRLRTLGVRVDKDFLKLLEQAQHEPID